MYESEKNKSCKKAEKALTEKQFIVLKKKKENLSNVKLFVKASHTTFQVSQNILPAPKPK